MLVGAKIETSKDTSYEVLHYRTGMTNARPGSASSAR